jgi:RNA processing factor Prp31
MNDDKRTSMDGRGWTLTNIEWKLMNVGQNCDKHQIKLRQTSDGTTTDIRRNCEERLMKLGLALDEITKNVGQNYKECWTKLQGMLGETLKNEMKRMVTTTTTDDNCNEQRLQ